MTKTTLLTILMSLLFSQCAQKMLPIKANQLIVVNRTPTGKGKQIGFWVSQGSNGDFANMTFSE